VVQYGWDRVPLTLLPAGDIADMGRMLRNLSDLHLHHPDLLRASVHHKAEYVGGRHWTSGPGIAGTHQQREFLLCLVWHRNGGYHHTDHRRTQLPQLPTWGERAAFQRAHCSPSAGSSSGSGSGSRHHLGTRPLGSVTTNPDGADASVST